MSAPSTLWPRRALSSLWSREPALTSHASCWHLELKTSQPPDLGAYTVWVVKDTVCTISPQLSKGPRQDGQNNLVLGDIKIWKSQQFPPEPLPCSHHECPSCDDSVIARSSLDCSVPPGTEFCPFQAELLPQPQLPCCSNGSAHQINNAESVACIFSLSMSLWILIFIRDLYVHKSATFRM